MRNFILGISVSIAFIVGALASPHIVPTASAATNPTKWGYKCFREISVSTVESKANKAGAEGWELVAAATPGVNNAPMNWCFKQHG